jgi:elongator complex protein 3
MVINKMKDLEIHLNISEDNILKSGKNGEIINIEKDDKEKNILDSQLDITKVQKINEKSSHKVIGLTLETRPDFITKDELVRMRKYGCTRIEIGVQTLDDDVQIFTKRGHLRKHVINAMRLMKDFGFKVCFHLMPGLPSSTIEKDLKMMKEIFSNPDFRPDFIKIYPCMVLPNTDLSKIWEKGDFIPLSDKELVKLLLQFYAFVPEWTRVMRLMRDIPATSVLDGAKFSNLRQILESQPKKLKEIVGNEFYENHITIKNQLFKDIRSKEVGFSNEKYKDTNIILKRRDYEASKGKEVFLSFESEDEKTLFALLRLRKPSGKHSDKLSKVLENAGLIREVHSYGSEVAVGNKDNNTQHKGLGKKLLLEAEKIAKEEWLFNKISIIAGIGTREYYKKFGYEEANGYMFKNL